MNNKGVKIEATKAAMSVRRVDPKSRGGTGISSTGFSEVDAS
jgi:hypothetical protein